MATIANKTEKQEYTYFRCPVHEDQGQAVLCSRRRRLDVRVQETSIDGFTVLVKPQDANRLAIGRPWVLEYNDARVEVHGQWFFNAPDGHVQMGLRRLRDLTQPVKSRMSFFNRRRNSSSYGSGFSGVAFSGVLLLVFVVLALPGVGDALGTAPQIENALMWLYTGVSDILRSVR